MEVLKWMIPSMDQKSNTTVTMATHSMVKITGHVGMMESGLEKSQLANVSNKIDKYSLTL